MLEICLWVFTSGTGIVDIPEKATECLQLFLLSSSYFFASAFHGLCFVHVGISPTILRTSQWVAFIGWSPSLIRWIKYGQFAVVVFLYIYISLSLSLSLSFVRLFLETDRVDLPSVHAVRFGLNQYCKQRIDLIASKQNWGLTLSLLTEVFVCCASRWPRQPLNLLRLGTAWPC